MRQEAELLFKFFWDKFFWDKLLRYYLEVQRQKLLETRLSNRLLAINTKLEINFT